MVGDFVVTDAVGVANGLARAVVEVRRVTGVVARGVPAVGVPSLGPEGRGVPVAAAAAPRAGTALERAASVAVGWRDTGDADDAIASAPPPAPAFGVGVGVVDGRAAFPVGVIEPALERAAGDRFVAVGAAVAPDRTLAASARTGPVLAASARTIGEAVSAAWTAPTPRGTAIATTIAGSSRRAVARADAPRPEPARGFTGRL